MMRKPPPIAAVIMFLILLLGIFSLNSREAMAFCTCGDCKSVIENDCQSKCICVSDDETGEPDKKETTMGHITDEFNKHRDWMVEIFFKDPKKGDKPGLLAAMELMTNQLVNIGMQQVQVIGTFFDAKHQLESQRLFQQLTAKAHKDYHPSEELCEFGTVSRSLAASFRNTDLTAAALSKRSTGRQLLSEDMIGTEGIESDQPSRLVQFIKKYCDPQDNAGNLDALCKKGGEETELFNKDVNYTSTIDSPLTLELDFSEKGKADKTPDEEAVYALTANLFSHRLIPYIEDSKLLTSEDVPNMEGAAQDYLDVRALIAKRSVASNSIASIAALKTKGDPEAQPFLYALIKEMGAEEGEGALSVEDIKELLGENPSYYAQMEILTKKLYQNPNFYTELYDKPANVLRKDVAIQAATLMQKRDLYRSYLRSEMILAVMLEAALMDEQEKVTNEVSAALKK